MQEDFRPIPFYFLNKDLDRSEILRQIPLLKKSGISGVFLHARCGLTERGYGGRTWFEDIEFLVRELKNAGLKAWLYDEDPYPSGAAGGRICLEHPEFIAKSLRIEILYANSEGVAEMLLGEVQPLAAYEVGGEDLGDCFGVVRKRFYRKNLKVAYYGGQPVSHPRAATFWGIFSATRYPVFSPMNLYPAECFGHGLPDLKNCFLKSGAIKSNTNITC